MNLNITFRHMEATDSIKAHVEEKVEKFKKYLIRPIEVHVILYVEKFRQYCEITVSSSHFHATAIEGSENLYSSIDSAVHKIERQIKKHKEITKEHKTGISPVEV